MNTTPNHTSIPVEDNFDDPFLSVWESGVFRLNLFADYGRLTWPCGWIGMSLAEAAKWIQENDAKCL